MDDFSTSSFNDLLWRDISTAPKDGTKIIGWLAPNEVNAPEKAKPWIMWWKEKPFGMWITEGWSDPMSFAPTHWMPKP